MNRTLQYANLIGVVLLTCLCVVQWQRDRRLHLDLNRVEKIRIEQEEKISEQEKAMQGLTRDLALFKDQFTETHSNLLAARKTSENRELDLTRVISERDQLRTSITNWKQAVTLRDERLGEMEKQLRSVTEKANESIRKFNELATNYNSVVDQLNAARKAAAGTPAAKQ